MKRFELNDLLINGRFWKDLRVGLTKGQIENLLEKPLGKADIESDDVAYYILETETGVKFALVLDKEGVCFDLKLELDENRDFDFTLNFEGELENISETIQFERLLDLISKINVEWEFDSTRTFLQTVCLKLSSGIRLFYAFGSKLDNDYGFFSIRSVLETHKFV